jgi:hypothetical protein
VKENVEELNGEAENHSGSESEEEQPPPDEAEIFTDVIGWNVSVIFFIYLLSVSNRLLIATVLFLKYF